MQHTTNLAKSMALPVRDGMGQHFSRPELT